MEVGYVYRTHGTEQQRTNSLGLTVTTETAAAAAYSSSARQKEAADP